MLMLMFADTWNNRPGVQQKYSFAAAKIRYQQSEIWYLYTVIKCYKFFHLSYQNLDSDLILKALTKT